MADHHHPDTWLVRAGRPERPGAPLNHPITPASNFLPGGEHWYSRADGTETTVAFEAVVGGLEGGSAVSYASGMAAVAATLELVPTAGTVAIPVDVYHGVSQLVADAAPGRWSVLRVETGDTDGWVEASSEADLLFVETPSNPLLEIADLPEIGRRRRPGSILVVDSTFATPLGQRPLDLGADVVVHSATKFLSGHSDAVLGVAVVRDAATVVALKRRRTLTGAAPGALESFLALRGIRTLSVRMTKAQHNAGELARRLSAHPRVRRVRHPGLAGHPGHDIAAHFMAGFGAMIGFEVDDDAVADSVVSRLDLIVPVTSLGGVETTLERRSGYPGSEHLPPGLIRMSVGIEDVDDLWADLERALDPVAAR